MIDPDNLPDFIITNRPAPVHYQILWDCYTLYDAVCNIDGVYYKAWGTWPEEAVKKMIDLIMQDYQNGAIRKIGSVVQ